MAYTHYPYDNFHAMIHPFRVVRINKHILLTLRRHYYKPGRVNLVQRRADNNAITADPLRTRVTLTANNLSP